MSPQDAPALNPDTTAAAPVSATHGAAWWDPLTASDIVRRCAWFAFPIAGVLWTATRYRNNWYYFDEWAMIDRSRGSWGAILDGHLGHLMVWNFLIYRFQRTWFGVQGHWLVYLGFCASLTALQLSVAALLRRLGLPTLLALLAATMITFFGPGAQDMLWEFQQNVNFVLALSFVAAVVALRSNRTPRAAVAIAALLVVAVTTDSAVAILGVAFVGVVVVVLWPRRLALISLGPPIVAHLAWFALGDQGRNGGGSLTTIWTFASRLFTLSAAGLVGGGETPSPLQARPTAATFPLSGTKMGLIVLLIATVCVAFGFGRHRLSREVVANLVGGVTAAVLGVIVLAMTRAFEIIPAAFPGTRFVQWIAILLLVGFVPAISATLRPTAPRARALATAAAAVALIAVFVVNLGQLRPTQLFLERWSTGVEVSARQTVTVIGEGCRDGHPPDPHAKPTIQSPQITVRLIRDLLADGALTPRFGIPATRATRDAICRTALH
jgi:hypothetical protein